MVQAGDRVVEDYLDRLERELADLPRARRRELLTEIEEHIAAARAQSAGAGEAEVRTLLERLGEPDEIAAEARERLSVPAPAAARRAGFTEIGAVIMLPVGGLVLPFVGWVIGVVLLWLSSAWNLRDKLIGTFVLPGGLLFPLVVPVVLIHFLATDVSGVPCGIDTPTGECPPDDTSRLGQTVALAVWALMFVLPIASAIYLGVRLRRANR